MSVCKFEQLQCESPVGDGSRLGAGAAGGCVGLAPVPVPHLRRVSRRFVTGARDRVDEWRPTTHHHQATHPSEAPPHPPAPPLVRCWPCARRLPPSRASLLLLESLSLSRSKAEGLARPATAVVASRWPPLVTHRTTSSSSCYSSETQVGAHTRALARRVERRLGCSLGEQRNSDLPTLARERAERTHTPARGREQGSTNTETDGAASRTRRRRRIRAWWCTRPRSPVNRPLGTSFVLGWRVSVARWRWEMGPAVGHEPCACVCGCPCSRVLRLVVLLSLVRCRQVVLAASILGRLLHHLLHHHHRVRSQ